MFGSQLRQIREKKFMLALFVKTIKQMCMLVSSLRKITETPIKFQNTILTFIKVHQIVNSS